VPRYLAGNSEASCFRTKSELDYLLRWPNLPAAKVADDVKEKFDVEVTRQHVHRYDPACAQPPAPRWCELFTATRAAFLADLAEIGVAHRNVRLRMLDRLACRAEVNKFSTLTANLLDQAARECGGFYDRKPRSR
jgi:hypothetical protein